MRVLEQLVVSKTTNPLDCEDLIFFNSHYAAVIDGVTSQIKRSTDEISPGRKAAELIAQALSTLTPNASKETVFTTLNREILQYYQNHNLLQEALTQKKFRCGASVVLYSAHYREVWRVGDCPFLIDGQTAPPRKTLDTLLAEVRACFLETELRLGKQIEDLLIFDTGRAYIQEMISRQIVFQNSDIPSSYNFEVIDGFFHHLERIEVYPVPANARVLILASDGYPELKPTLEESEQYLKQIIDKDPLCFRMFKTTKGVYRENNSFDDRAYLKIDLST